MDRKQYFTNCKYCGKQILMTRNIDSGRFIPCDPLIRFYGSADPLRTDKERYIDPDGHSCFGVRTSSDLGVPGYRKHKCRMVEEG